MTTQTKPSESPAWWRQLRLRADGRFIGGVGGGLADAIDVDPLVIRVAFVVLLMAGGVGGLIYVLLWAVMALAQRQDAPTQAAPRRTSGTEGDHLAAVALITTGLLLLIRSLGLGFVDSLVWPVALLGLGLLITVARTGVDIGRLSGITTGEGRRGTVFARIAAGIGLAVGGFAALLAFNLDLGAARDVALAAIVITAGLALVLGPWLWRLIDDVGDERRRRIRSEERSELAAQLHDSVLQTLSLIQRNSHDPATMVQLARGQERELRAWLYGDGLSGRSDKLGAGLETAANDVELQFHVPIDVVVVGDVPADERIAGLLAAAREAMLNASRHSGADKIDVYAEATDDEVVVFVRDTGIGFDPDAVDEDRRGLADSIIGRLERLGGRGDVHSSPGEGTEVELTLPRREAKADRS